MTREALLARKAALLPIYSEPNPEHELQALEVESELMWIDERLKELPRQAKEPELPKARGWTRDGRARAARNDE